MCIRKQRNSGGITARLTATISSRPQTNELMRPWQSLQPSSYRRPTVVGCARQRCEDRYLDDSHSSRTFYKADRVRGPASKRVDGGSTATPQLRERCGGRDKCLRHLFREGSSPDADTSERILSLAKTAEDTNRILTTCMRRS